MGHEPDGRLPGCPIPDPAAPEWAEPRRGRPVAPVRPAVEEVLPRGLPGQRPAVAPEEPEQVGGLVAGGLRDVPVRW